MITFTTQAGSDTWQLYGKSTDEKPTDNIPNGSIYYEMDGDHKVFMFDGDTKSWLEQ